MAFEPGRQKTGGRKPGTPNRKTSEIRETLHSIMDEEIQHLPELLKALEPAKRIEAVIRLMPYVMPRIQAETDGAQNYEPDSPPSWFDGSPLAPE